MALEIFVVIDAVQLDNGGGSGSQAGLRKARLANLNNDGGNSFSYCRVDKGYAGRSGLSSFSHIC